MKFRMRFLNQVVGLFIIIAVVFLIFLVGSTGVSQHWFERHHTFHSDFASAQGLGVGMTISYKGFEIGKVSDVQLTPDNKVDVSFYIRDRYYSRVTRNSVLQLVTNPLGLGGGLVFHPGTVATPPLADGSMVPTWDTAEAKSWRGQGLVENAQQDDTIATLINQVGPILSQANHVLGSVDTLLATLDGTLKGTQAGPVRDLLARTSDAVQNVSGTVSDLRRGSNVTLENVNSLLSKLEDVSGNLETLSAQLSDTQGLVPRLLGAKGSIPTLLDDQNALYGKINDILTSLKQSAAQIAGVAQFLNNSTPQLSAILEEGRQAVTTGQDVLEGVKNNPLIRGGVPAQQQEASPVQGYRGGGF